VQPLERGADAFGTFFAKYGSMKIIIGKEMKTKTGIRVFELRFTISIFGQSETARCYFTTPPFSCELFGNAVSMVIFVRFVEDKSIWSCLQD